MNDYSEDNLIEQPAIELLGQLGWETANCFNEFEDGDSFLGRETKGDVVIVPRLLEAMEKLNSDLTGDAFAKAIEQITRDRSAMSMAAANREVNGMACPVSGLMAVRVCIR